MRVFFRHGVRVGGAGATDEEIEAKIGKILRGALVLDIYYWDWESLGWRTMYMVVGNLDSFLNGCSWSTSFSLAH
jgi:hypothetical protein